MKKSEENFNKDIGQKIKELRQEKGLSQNELVDILKKYNKMITRPTLSKIESGKNKISAHMLMDFCDIFKVDPSKILHTKDIVTLRTSNNDIIISLKTRKNRKQIIEILKNLKTLQDLD